MNDNNFQYAAQIKPSIILYPCIVLTRQNIEVEWGETELWDQSTLAQCDLNFRK